MLANSAHRIALTLALAGLALTGASSASASPLLVTDGGFESPVVSGVSDLGDGQVFGGWHVVGSVDVVDGQWQNTEGNQSVDLNGVGPGAIYQDVPTIPGHSYTLAFDYAGNPYGDPGLKEMQVKWNGQVENTESIDTTGNDSTDMGWIHRSYGSLAASTGVTTRVEFDSYQTDGEYGPTLDAVSLVDNGPASAAPACAAAGNCNWNLANDAYQNMTGIPSNPLPDSLGDQNVWSYREGGDYVGACRATSAPHGIGADQCPRVLRR